jgi:hypothetical protein
MNEYVSYVLEVWQIFSFGYILQLMVEMWHKNIIVKMYMFYVCNPV